MDISYIVGLVIIAAVVAAVVKFGFLKKDAPTPPTTSVGGGTPGNVFNGNSPSGFTEYEVFADAGQPGEVTYTNVNNEVVTAIVTPPSIRILAKDGTAIDGNYGIIKAV